MLDLKSPQHAKELLEHYFTYAKIDGKPEKGERKQADDFIVLLNEDQRDCPLEHKLYMTALNEHVLLASPYNFDINMH